MDANHYFKNPALQEVFDSVQLVIFDMNGLIIDDEQLQLESVNLTLDPHQIRINGDYWIRNCVGKRADNYFSAIMKENMVEKSEYDITILIREKNKYYHNLITQRVGELVRPGVCELVDFISADHRYKLALGTSAHPMEIESILGKRGLRLKSKFNYIASGMDVKKSKPDPEIYNFLLSQSGVIPEKCLVIEDSSIGVNAAYRAGIASLAVPNQFTMPQDFSKALYVIDNLTKEAKIMK